MWMKTNSNNSKLWKVSRPFSPCISEYIDSLILFYGYMVLHYRDTSDLFNQSYQMSF